jgi:predicted nucleotidyltransferase
VSAVNKNKIRIHPTGSSMRKSDLNKIKAKLSPVFTDRNVKKAVIFGSFARNSQTKKSDLDLLIITKTDKRPGTC